MVDDGQMDDGSWVYYKLTNESKGSGEVTKILPASKIFVKHSMHSFFFFFCYCM